MIQDQEPEEVKAGVLYLREGAQGLFQRPLWKEKWFVLSGKTLCFFKNQKSYEELPVRDRKRRARGVISLENSKLKESHEVDALEVPFKKECVFQIITPDNGQHYLSAKTPDVCANWIRVLRDMMTGGYNLNSKTVTIQENLRKVDFELAADTLEFDNSDDVIGAGASGVVRKGRWLKSTPVAVKALKNLPELTDTKELTGFFQEIDTLSKLRHSNIVQMYGFCRKDNYICLVTEYVKGGNLSEGIHNPNCQLDFMLQVELAMSISRGMVYLHNQNVIHRDLKPANILIESWPEGKVKVCDFGISKVERMTLGTAEAEDSLGSPQYAAPELGQESHDFKVDVFSFAVVLLELSTRTLPWPEIKFGSEFAERYGAGRRPPIPLGCPFDFLIRKCWDPKPTERFTFSQVYDELEKLKQEEPRIRSSTAPPLPSQTYANGAPRPLPSGAINRLNSGPLPTGHRPTMNPPIRPKAPSHTASNPNLPVRPLSPNSSPTTSPPNMGRSLPVMPYVNGGPTSPSLNGKMSQMGPKILPRPNSGGSPSIKMTGAQPVLVMNGNYPPGGVVSTMNAVFGDKVLITWTAFCNALSGVLKTNPQNIEKLRFIFDSNCAVTKTIWDDFMQWFSPFTIGDEGGYDIGTVVEICAPPHFHGFLEGTDAQRKLKGRPDGTFLLRFSTQPGNYTLTVAYSGTVGHWRIQCEKEDGKKPVFKLDGRTYSSLDDLIQTHKSGKEPLKIKQTRPGLSPVCFLSAPYCREEDTAAFYQSI
eukprot:TRINITY_DN720_c0_g1_i3.p1 TRINITY_DN720_c0_g1~~TRINITY_DN720_c0_g1_i3.p1  ORF type:complete len:760 (-),score=164.71 TRINITY_DN720_c0_g1_i3:51-2330(-)